MFQFQHARHISVCKLMGENWRPTKASLWVVCTTGHLTRTGCWWRASAPENIIPLGPDPSRWLHQTDICWKSSTAPWSFTPGNYWSALRTSLMFVSQFPPEQHAFSCLDRLISNDAAIPKASHMKTLQIITTLNKPYFSSLPSLSCSSWFNTRLLSTHRFFLSYCQHALYTCNISE